MLASSHMVMQMGSVENSSPEIRIYQLLWFIFPHKPQDKYVYQM